MEYWCQYHSPIGLITMRSDGKSLTGLWFDGQKYFPERVIDVYEKRSPLFEDAGRWLDTYFSGQIPAFMPQICLEGTPFRMRVWQILLTIPYGQSMTYGDIARRIASESGLRSMSAQAVGSAVGHNPISLIVPCHRIIGADGSLTGYAGGLEKKRYLLEMEKRSRSGVHRGDLTWI